MIDLIRNIKRPGSILCCATVQIVPTVMYELSAKLKKAKHTCTLKNRWYLMEVRTLKLSKDAYLGVLSLCKRTV